MRLGLREKKDLREMYRRRRLNKIRLICAGVFVVIAAVSLVIWGPAFRLESVVVAGASRDDAPEIASLAHTALLAKGGIFPASMLFSLPEEETKRKLLEKHADIEDVTFDWKDRHTVVVHIKDRLAAFLWCGEDMHSIEKACYYMSPDGVILGEAPVFSGSHYIEFYGAITEPVTKTNKEGDGVFSGGSFDPTFSFESLRILLAAVPLGSLVRSVEVGRDGNLALYTKEGWFVRTNSDENALDVAKRLEVALTTAEVKSKIEARTLEYIDVRYDNRVFFK